jgi:hypothetical protein
MAGFTGLLEPRKTTMNNYTAFERIDQEVLIDQEALSAARTLVEVCWLDCRTKFEAYQLAFADFRDASKKVRDIENGQ